MPFENELSSMIYEIMNNKGMTIKELLVVLLIMIVLITAAIPLFYYLRDKRNAPIENDIFITRQQLQTSESASV